MIILRIFLLIVLGDFIHGDFTVKKKKERYKSSYALKHKTNKSFDTDEEKINN